MKRGKDGDIFRFALGDGRYGYGMLVNIYQRIFNHLDNGDATVDLLLQKPWAFTKCISLGTQRDDRIERIGSVKIPADMVKE